MASAATAAHGAELILKGERLVYALCRPPGHHAAADMAAGFCYFNNAAIAAEILTRAGKRTAILDIDVHHGNGTEAIFYDRADVLTVSIHAHPKRFYPFFWGYAEETGRGAGEGFNLNLPLERGTTLKPYLAALDVALRRVSDFAPDVLVLAAGLDIAVDDPFKGFAIATPEFAEIGKAIAALKLPMLVVQEGGYPSPSLGANLGVAADRACAHEHRLSRDARRRSRCRGGDGAGPRRPCRHVVTDRPDRRKTHRGARPDRRGGGRGRGPACSAPAWR